VPVTRPCLVEQLTRVARFQIYRRREREWVTIDCPDDVAETYLAREGAWRVPPLIGVTNAPMLRADGSLFDQPGYDRATRLIYEPDGANIPAISASPSRRDAERALAVIDDLISTFPFVEAIDRSVALSGILTALDRRAVLTTPLHGFSAPVAGSGKTMLVDICSMIATGRAAPVIDQGREEPELDKRLVAAFLRGGSVISIDNCERPLASSLLCQALTATGPMQLRLLGQSRDVEVPNVATLYCTGNHLALAGDLTRRAVISRLDPRCERPELREFDCSPLDVIRADRGAYVAAALTILRAYLVSGERVSATPIGSFEGWSRRVREALIWLGRADPCDSMTELRGSDPTLVTLRALIAAWDQYIGGDPITARGIVDLALRRRDPHDPASPLAYPELNDVLITIAGHGREIDPRRLGKWIGRVANRIADRRCIIAAGMYAGTQRWRISDAA
jgi:putative DNA primase/helicase